MSVSSVDGEIQTWLQYSVTNYNTTSLDCLIWLRVGGQSVGLRGKRATSYNFREFEVESRN